VQVASHQDFVRRAQVGTGTRRGEISALRWRVLLTEAAEALRNRWTAPPVDALIPAGRVA
jgi:hypothetical protein